MVLSAVHNRESETCHGNACDGKLCLLVVTLYGKVVRQGDVTFAMGDVHHRHVACRVTGETVRWVDSAGAIHHEPLR